MQIALTEQAACGHVVWSCGVTFCDEVMWALACAHDQMVHAQPKGI
jgi:hypothetical protein